MEESRRPSSQDFAAQIRQLEMEGSKLRAAVSNLGSSLGASSWRDENVSSHTIPSHSLQTDVSRGSYQPSSPSLAALADISQEQRTLNDLRSQLDVKMRETEQMTRNLLDNHQHPISSVGHVTSSLAPAPNETLTVSHLSSALPASVLESQLKDTREEAIGLRQRLREALNISEEQKQHFRKNIEELKSQLQEAIIGRDNILEVKQREAANQESVMAQLRSKSEQLEQVNIKQEKTLLELNSKLEVLQKEKFSTESALNQLRGLVGEREQRRGRAYYEAEPVTSQSPAMLVHSVERCLHDYDREADRLNEKNKDLESQLSIIKSQATDRQQLLQEEHQERLTRLTREHDQQVSLASDRALTARKQAASLQEQLDMLQQQTEQQMQLKDERMRDMEGTIKQLREDYGNDKEHWKQKHEALQLSLDQTQRELNTLMSERDEAIQKQAATESRFTDLQETIRKLETDLDLEREQTRKMSSQDIDVQRREDALRSRLQDKEREIERLQSAISATKQESELHLHQTVSTLEKEEQKKYTDQVKSLTSQLSELTEKSHKTTLDFELTKQELNNVRDKYTAVLSEQSEMRRQLDAALDRKSQLSALLEDRSADVERLSQERDYYFKVLEERKKEIVELQSKLEKASIQLAEKDKSLAALQQQNANIAQMVEISSKTSGDVKEEKEKLIQEIKAKAAEMEEIKQIRDNIIKKLKIRESRLKEVEAELEKVRKQLQDKVTELGEVQKQKETLFKELRESRYEVSTLAEDRDRAKANLEQRESELGKQISKLSAKIKVAEHDLKLARKALKTHESVDGKAAKVAGKMQKEVTEKRSQIDFLQSQVSWLEECLDTAIKEKKSLQDESMKLSNKVKVMSSKNSELNKELAEQQTKMRRYNDKVTKLEAALEKAALKYAAAQAKLEEHEQDTARLKLKHQLQLKELQRSGQFSVSAGGDDLLKTHTTQAGTGVTKGSHGGSPITVGSHGDRGVPLTTSSVSKKPATADQPVNIKPSRPTQVASNVTLGPLGEELRGLVGEMRNLVEEQKQSKPPDPLPQDRPKGDRYTESSEENLSDTADDFSGADKPSRHRSRHKHTAKPARASASHKTSRSAKGKHKPSSHSGKYPLSAGQTSPVSDLLGVSRQGPDSDSVSLARVAMETPYHHALGAYSNIRPPSRSTATHVTPLSAETQDLCKRLEKKMEALSRMGGHLQHENRETAALIKEQDRKLKKMMHNKEILKSQC